MKYRMIVFFILLSIFLAATAGFASGPTPIGTHTPQEFKNYWFSSRAEISRFSLDQARYGETHSGDAVFVFVTETMNPQKQVKADNPGAGDIPVLKLNAVRKFFTGMYPYSVMTSVFAPVDSGKYPLPLKISASTQEWCGHVYLQMNLRGDEYRVATHSYFEKEGDQEFGLKTVLPEDALWTRIRIAPDTLPQGEFSIIPSATYTRFAHRPLKSVDVVGTLTSTQKTSLEGVPLVRYDVRFKNIDRTIRIYFERAFPYRIQSWEDTHRATGRAPKVVTTRATRTHTLMIDYWKRHGNKDRAILKQLGIPPRELPAG